MFECLEYNNYPGKGGCSNNCMVRRPRPILHDSLCTDYSDLSPCTAYSEPAMLLGYVRAVWHAVYMTSWGWGMGSQVNVTMTLLSLCFFLQFTFHWLLLLWNDWWGHTLVWRHTPSPLVQLNALFLATFTIHQEFWRVDKSDQMGQEVSCV